MASGDYRSLKEAYSRLHGAAGSELVYTATGQLLEIRIFAFEADEAPNLQLQVSRDGRDWSPVEARIEAFVSPEKNYDYRVPLRYRYAFADPEARYLKAVFGDVADIVRVELVSTSCRHSSIGRATHS